MVNMRKDQHKHFISYTTFGIMMTQVCDRIKETIVLEECTGVYGQARGGLPLAVHLSHKLNLRFLDKPLPGCIVIDDIADSGETLKKITEGIDCLLTVTLHWKEKSIIKPDIYITEAPEETWIVYPWEI